MSHFAISFIARLQAEFFAISALSSGVPGQPDSARLASISRASADTACMSYRPSSVISLCTVTGGLRVECEPNRDLGGFGARGDVGRSAEDDLPCFGRGHAGP